MTTASDTKLIIALDAMGGDNAPHAVLAGAENAHAAYPDVQFLLYGDEATLAALLPGYPKLQSVSRIMHAEAVVSPDDKPSTALRQGKRSSMRLAIDAVNSGEAAAMVSAGNTGALMAMSKIVLKTLPGIDRPAICTIMPTIRGKTVMLDLGANVDCNSDNLFQFALMGNAFARVMLKVESPTIGLLNIGSEDVKGNEVVKSAAALLKETAVPLNFIGYVEGNDIAEGTADVVVTDGFSGNIALKTAEGTAKICRDFMKQAFRSSLLARIGCLLARPALTKFFSRIDHRFYNGAMLVGLNGIIVKSHGGADALGLSSAICVAIELAAHTINNKIIDEVAHSHQVASPLLMEAP